MFYVYTIIAVPPHLYLFGL